ncbi:MAG: IclR family transcriptional regulator [Actinobacteria bacterium]|nr:MAG: IclR family transcriptional regulator [Actinomycetota bacterium]
MARPAPAAARAASIISFLTAHPSRAFTISELVRHLDMNIASAHATIAVLTDCGFLVRDPAHKTYTLGPALAATGFAAMAQHPAVAAAIEQAELLSEELDVEVGVSAIAGRDVILLARRGPEPLSTAIGYPGDRAPLLAPFGAVFMAWADDATVDEWLQRADADAAARNFYGQALAEIRTRGFGVPLQAIASPEIEDAMLHLRDEPTAADAEGRLKKELRAGDEALVLFSELSPTAAVNFKTVAAPIFDPIGRVLLSMAITGPGHSVPLARVLELGHRLVQSAAVATRQGQGRAPDHY